MLRSDWGRLIRRVLQNAQKIYFYQLLVRHESRMAAPTLEGLSGISIREISLTSKLTDV
jgi:hypothetical protein